ncbi:unnamed protein product [Larinioides sclopetarius]|uniref:Secreted protein n=1 Tax=Larinioides sclopetarius TaxID=280406 RepID=A0AAV2AQU6_9ARAC
MLRSMRFTCVWMALHSPKRHVTADVTHRDWMAVIKSPGKVSPFSKYGFERTPGRDEACHVVHLRLPGGGPLPVPLGHPVRARHPGGLQLP